MNKYYLVDIMGLIQSISAATKASNVAPTPVADTSSNTVEPKSLTEPVKVVELVKEQTESTIVKEAVEEVKPEEVKPVENVPKTPNSTLNTAVTSAVTSAVTERYVTPIGTKVEVAPVEVTQAVDVVKKNKNKNKNKNSKKD
jgi:hypothetical protein